MPTLEDFRANVVAFAERVAKFRDKVSNEEATKVALILPFLGMLGYDERDPSEVAPEFPADFSEKYRNRVDYAVLMDGKPAIAVECKTTNNAKKDDRGQLKAYFNAAKTVKLGILTDGVVFEFFVDSNEPNMMDDDPYLTIDFGADPKTAISDTALDGLYALTKQAFNSETISENARRSILYRAFYDYLSDQFGDPSAEFTRFMLKEMNMKHIRAAALDAYRDIAKAAFKDVFNSHVLRQLDITSTMPMATARSEPTAVAPSAEPQAGRKPDNGIVTTEAELAAFEQIRRRLAFLAGGDGTLYDAIGRVQFRDYQGKMAVFYQLERKGRLADIVTGKDDSIRFVVMDGGDTAPISDLAEADERLRALFVKRVADVG